MIELKKHFNCIEGAKDENSWKFERSLNKKIIKPAQKIAVC